MLRNVVRLRSRIGIILVFLLLCMLLVVLVPLKGAQAEDHPLALIDFSGSDAAEFYTSLDGEWFYFEEQLLQPTEVYSFILRDYARTVQLPSSFKEQGGISNTYGTYATRVKIPRALVGRTLAIHIPHQYSAYKLYADLIEIASNGRVGSSAEEHESELSPKLGYFVPRTDELLLTMQISNFEHQRGGFEHSIFIGEASEVAQKFNTSIIWMLFVVGCIFIMGMFMILFAWFRRQEKLFLIFGLFCICFAIRAFFADPFFYSLTLLQVSYLWGTRLEYLFTHATVLLLVFLVYEWYKQQFSKQVLKLITFSITAAIVTTLITKPIVFQRMAEYLFCFAVLGFVYLVYVIYRGYREQHIRNFANIVGLTLVSIGLFNDFMLAHGWIKSVSLSLLAVGLYVVIQVFMMSKSYADKVLETEQLNQSLTTLNATLDDQVNRRTKELRSANEQLEHLASKDALTGIYNRHRFNAFMQEAFKQAKENCTPLSLIMLDLDEFKKYNDHYGHIQGDALLKQVVKLIGEQLPENSLFARFGGEEFVVVLPACPLAEAYQLAEQMRSAVEFARLPHAKRELGYATISIGVAALEHKSLYRSEIELMDAADQQLYRSKREGRNRTSVARLKQEQPSLL